MLQSCNRRACIIRTSTHWCRTRATQCGADASIIRENVCNPCPALMACCKLVLPACVHTAHLDSPPRMNKIIRRG